MPEAGRWRHRAIQATAVAAALALTLVFLAMLADLVQGGGGRLTPAFLVQPVRDAGRAGGILPVLVSTMLVLLVCLGVALPLGLGAALYLSEVAPRRSPGARALRFSLDVLAGVPSIVFGLFGAAFFCGFLGLGFSLLAGGLTLACMVLPLLIRTSEEALRAVPTELREAAAALGLSRATTWRRLVLPAAAPGLVVAVLLSIGRALSETAALLFTSGYVPRMPGSLMDSGRVLSIHVYDLSMNVPGGEAGAKATALVLLAALVCLNRSAHLLAVRWRAARRADG